MGDGKTSRCPPYTITETVNSRVLFPTIGNEWYNSDFTAFRSFGAFIGALFWQAPEHMWFGDAHQSLRVTQTVTGHRRLRITWWSKPKSTNPETWHQRMKSKGTKVRDSHGFVQFIKCFNEWFTKAKGSFLLLFFTKINCGVTSYC